VAYVDLLLYLWPRGFRSFDDSALPSELIRTLERILRVTLLEMTPCHKGGDLGTRLSALQAQMDSKNSSPELEEAIRLLGEMGRRLERSAREQTLLEERVARLENSVVFQILRKIGFEFHSYKRKLGQKLLSSPLHPVYLRLFGPARSDVSYENWVQQQQAGERSMESYQEEACGWHSRPLISVVMAVHRPQAKWLAAAVESVMSQTYPFWELCICDDASPPWVGEYLKLQSEKSQQIRYCVSRERLGISGALNRAGALARGAYVGFLDHDDVLSPVALHHVAEALQSGPADVIYTDEDHLDQSGRRSRPSLKPDWSPDLLSGCMYWGHFMVVARRRLDEVGWFRSEYDGSQDYDLALRITDGPAMVLHVPRILYHWRQHPDSTALAASAKPYTHDAGRRALEDAIRRRNWDAEANDGAIANAYYVRRKLAVKPQVSLIVCSRNGKLLSKCLSAVDRNCTGYDCQTVVVHHQTGDDRGMAKVLRAHRCDVVPFRDEFNFARMSNLGAAAATGDVLIFLNDDVTPLSADWLDHLLAHLQRPEVGVVGAKLVYHTGAIQHAGIVVGMMEGAGHAGRGLFQSDLWRWLNLTRNVSAVTAACMGLRRTVFDELGRFDPRYPVNYNDVDLCLRARQAGYEVVFEPHALLRHDEGQTRSSGTRREERDRFHEQWAAVLEKPDPYFNPLLSLAVEETRFSG
jgi:GT2 family glycosyltransferase